MARKKRIKKFSNTNQLNQNWVNFFSPLQESTNEENSTKNSLVVKKNKKFENVINEERIDSMSASLIERPARSSEKGKTLWKREKLIDKTGKVEIREEWDNELFLQREDNSIVPKLRENLQKKPPHSSSDFAKKQEREEIIYYSSESWKSRENEYKSEITVKQQIIPPKFK